MRTIAIIPARGGSKGLPRKNVRLLGGKPLIAWSVEAAQASGLCERVLVSTDDAEIAAAARGAGAWVPFTRPAELALDLTPTEPVLQHALGEAERRLGTFDAVVFLQPTDIFRRAEWITRAIEVLAARPELDCVFAATRTHKNFWLHDEAGRLRRVCDWMAVYGPRQTRQPLWREDTGLASALRARLVRAGRRTGDRAEIIPTDDPACDIDIHTEWDFFLAEQTLLWRARQAAVAPPPASAA
ncbi:MAG: acylneuraminate cytidylyltransferase family protein [Alphaproteobacteria bacterium]|nr:acylneuraminate cytidylyltransferase family protein [Alphaproteobacteria bacterium]